MANFERVSRKHVFVPVRLCKGTLGSVLNLDQIHRLRGISTFNVLKTVSILVKNKITRRHAFGGGRLVAWCEAVSLYGYIATDLDHASRLSP